MSRVAPGMQYFLKSSDKLITLEFPPPVLISSLTQTMQLNRSIVLLMAKVIMIAVELELCNKVLYNFEEFNLNYIISI